MNARAFLPITIIAAALFCVPFFAHAFPFGGQASIVLPCIYNSTIYVDLGPPRGGKFVWTTATRTYNFGPPRYAGQWLLGLAGAPYYCIYQIHPLTVYSAISISMMGSSGTAAPPAPSLSGGTTVRDSTPTSAGSGGSATPPPASSSTIGHIVISEVYYAVDAAHGTKPLNEWVEIYNGSASPFSLSGWSVSDAIASDTLPGSVVIAPGAFIVVAATSTTRALWNIPSSTPVVSLGNPIGDGLGNGGDRVILRNATGAIVDAISWGTNSSVFNPGVSVAPYGYSTARASLMKDTDTPTDWVNRAAPTPGK